MISKDVNTYTYQLFSNKISQINFTGSGEEWALKNIETTQPVFFYENDEGFINYWNDVVRTSEDIDVCKMSKEDFIFLKEKYDSLSLNDKLIVDGHIDRANQKIKDTMEYLKKYFEADSSKTKTKSNLPQDMTLGIIVGVAIFGMTTISIFYLLKKQGIIS